MEDLRVIVASNISRLRKDANLTQAELAEKINYSDKSVSKWERADALPDLVVIKQLSELFGVSVDFLLSSHDEWNVAPPQPSSPSYDSDIITSIAIIGIWALSLLIFLIFYFVNIKLWNIFGIATILSLITLLVLNNVWKKQKYNLLIISLLVLCIFTCVYFSLYSLNIWQIFFLWVLAEIIVILSFRIKRKKRK